MADPHTNSGFPRAVNPPYSMQNVPHGVPMQYGKYEPKVGLCGLIVHSRITIKYHGNIVCDLTGVHDRWKSFPSSGSGRFKG